VWRGSATHVPPFWVRSAADQIDQGPVVAGARGKEECGSKWLGHTARGCRPCACRPAGQPKGMCPDMSPGPDTRRDRSVVTSPALRRTLLTPEQAGPGRVGACHLLLASCYLVLDVLACMVAARRCARSPAGAIDNARL
jgi:hypothetical protein